MQAQKQTVERLAKEWLGEVKRLRSMAACACGCGESFKTKTRFRPGHDAKLMKDYRQRIMAILAAEAS